MGIKIFMDSGAYTAHSKGQNIDIDKYIEFIKKYSNAIDYYANLDVIGCTIKSAKGGWTNQRYMERQGLNPIPIFHLGEPKKYLKKYINRYDYIGLGGMVSGLGWGVMAWLEDVWENYLTDSQGKPIVKVHGFGMTTYKSILRYPWYSVDSTAWLMMAGNGVITIPKMGNLAYTRTPMKVYVSATKDKPPPEAYFWLSDFKKSHVDQYIESKGFTMQELIDKYAKRQEFNALYFQDLQEHIGIKIYLAGQYPNITSKRVVRKTKKFNRMLSYHYHYKQKDNEKDQIEYLMKRRFNETSKGRRKDV